MELWKGRKQVVKDRTYWRSLRIEPYQLFFVEKNQDADGHVHEGRHLAIGFGKPLRLGYYSAYYDGDWKAFWLGPFYIESYS
jgi:hypothetical protein